MARIIASLVRNVGLGELRHVRRCIWCPSKGLRGQVSYYTICKVITYEIGLNLS